MPFRSKAKLGLIFVIFITFFLLCLLFSLAIYHILYPTYAIIYGFIVILAGSVAMYYLLHLMMQEMEKTEEILIYQSTHDPITGLPNRIKFFEYLHVNLPKDKKTPMAIVAIGIDRFPQINHALGHRIGDRLLHHVGSKLKESLKNANIISRFASNVFIATFDHITPENFKTLADEILDIFETPFSVYTVTIDLDTLMGFSFFPQDGKDPDTLIQKADLALYAARYSIERYAIYHPEIDPRYYNKLSLMSELKEGLIQNEFELYFQPKINLKTGKVVHVEALIRWQHPFRGMIEPNQFIPLAEETGHIKKLTLWVIEKAILQCSIWQKQGSPLGIAINLSVKDLLNNALPSSVATWLKEHQVDPNLITFEITESAFMHDAQQARNAILKLKELNVHFSIDDFGTGFSSLQYLKTLPIDEIKIDRLFTEDVAHFERAANIMRATIELGHSINVRVVAEGIADDTTYQLIKEMGCDLGQGFFFAKPLSLTDLQKWLQASPWALKRVKTNDII